MNALVSARMIICLALALSLVACGGSSSSSAPTPAPAEVLDQDSGLTNGTATTVNNLVDRAQTFTVGESGFLSKIDLMLYERMPAGATLIIDVRETTGGAPNESDAINNVLLTFGVSTGALSTVEDEYVTFEVSQFGVQVTAGQVLAIVLRAPGGASIGYDWSSNDPDIYAGGAVYFRDHSGTGLWIANPNSDSGFRTHVTR